ncbi:MAG: four-helix bundle copper-binding protein [Opitutae bacterium]|nr:four-helix bundle copper-binding protein [Opitutae bacterium]
MSTLSVNLPRLLDTALLDSSLSALAECHAACHRCADAWLAHSPLGPDALRCIRLIVDCGDLCASAAEILPDAENDNPAQLRSRLNACVLACERCVREVSRHRAPHAAACIEACRYTAGVGRQLVSLLSTAAVAAA